MIVRTIKEYSKYPNTEIVIPIGTDIDMNLEDGLNLIADGTAVLVSYTNTVFNERKQTPTGLVQGVQIGPGDVISNIPVVIEFDHHQIHEGEAWQWFNFGALNATSRDIRISVPNALATKATPHVIFEVISDNTTASILLYEGTTWTAVGTDDSSKIYNRNRNVAGAPGTKIFITGATALTPNALGAQIYQGYLFAGTKGASSVERSLAEWDLKASTEYLLRVTTTGTGNVLARISFYEDLGV